MLPLDNNAAMRNLSALVDFSNLINSNLDLELTLSNLLLTCLSKFHTSKGIIALSDESGILGVKSSKGCNSEMLDRFPIVPVNSMRNNSILNDFIRENKFEVNVPIEASGTTIGVLLLGKRMMDGEYNAEDKEFLSTLINVAASAIENSIIVQKIKNVNRDLDAKVNQLSSLFDLSKEFSSIIDTERVGKLLVFSIIGQLLVTKFAVITCSDDDYELLENRFPEKELTFALGNCSKERFIEPMSPFSDTDEFKSFSDLGIDLIIPMKIKSETKGLILLGKKTTGTNYSRSDIEYISSIGSLAIISIENGKLFNDMLEKQRLEKDLEIAQNIQRNLLPNKLPRLNSYDIAAVNRSARQVGGDYYDVVQLDDHRVLVAIADVSGKGVQAALLMANLQAFLQSICKQNIALGEASNLINDLVSENTSDGSFITFFWGILDDKTKEFTYVNMGHNPPLLIRKATITKLKLGGMILGVLPTMIPYNFDTIQLEAEDEILLFTDGITEAMNKDKQEYSDKRLEKLSTSLAGETAQNILNAIISDVEKFSKGAPQSDDITVMVIKVN